MEAQYTGKRDKCCDIGVKETSDFDHQVLVAQSDDIGSEKASPVVTRRVSFPKWADYYIIHATTHGSLSFAIRLSRWGQKRVL